MAYTQHQYRSPFGDTTLTKVFVGGLAWETPTEKMRDYFQQFGDILEAVIITDKYTGHSKGYGFVTFREAESAIRACANPNPMIDGRRTNCNVASQGRPRTAPPRGRGDQGAASLVSPTSSQQFGDMQGMAPPPHNPFVYPPSYGYSPYTSGYGYHHGIYHPQQYQQQQQYYAQQLYGASQSSSLPYPYGYSMPSSRTMTFPPSQQRVPPYYYYYSEQASTSPNYNAANAVAGGASSLPSNNALQNPPLLSTPPTIRQQTPSTSSDSQAQQHRATKESEAIVVTAKESSST